MVRATVHQYNGDKLTIAISNNPKWPEYDVPSADWLYLDGNNKIQVHTQTEMDAIETERAHGVLVDVAKAELAKTDGVVVRSYEASLRGTVTKTDPGVLAYMQYRKSLRDIVDGTDTTSTELPAAPPFPSNT